MEITIFHGEAPLNTFYSALHNTHKATFRSPQRSFWSKETAKSFRVELVARTVVLSQIVIMLFPER